MTIRAVSLGLLAAAFIAAAGYFNDSVLALTPLVGNHLPVVVFGPLVLLLILAAFAPARRPWLRPGEAATILTMALAACAVPGRGFLASLSRNLVPPLRLYQNNLSWHGRTLEFAPHALLPNGGRPDDDFLNSLLQSAPPEHLLALDQVPWEPWAGPLAFWVPMALLLASASLCMGLIVHRQWSLRERLKYPIAEFASTLMAGRETPTGAPIFRTSHFRAGLLALLALHAVNGLAAWFPDSMISIPTQLNFWAIPDKYGWWVTHWQFYLLFCPTVWPIVVAVGYLIASEISFSLGVGQFVFIVITSFLIRNAGMTFLHGSEILGDTLSWQRAGSGLAVVVMLLYFGRRHYWHTLRATLFLPARGEVSGAMAWAGRGLFLCLAAMVALLQQVGLDWPLGILAVVLTLAIFLIQARVNTETGLFFTQLVWMPSGILFGLLGAKALGPQALVITALMALVFSSQIHECLLPFFLNALRISDLQKVPHVRSAWQAGLAFSVALAAGVPLALWADHNWGILRTSAGIIPEGPASTKDAFDRIANVNLRLQDDQELGASRGLSVWQRFASARPDPVCLWALGLGVSLVLTMTALRLRFIWWPIHPILFLLWGTWPMAMSSASLFLGWGAKQAVTRYGGTGAYAKGRLFMYGVIAGELVGALVWTLAGALFYLKTNQTPPPYHIFPSST